MGHSTARAALIYQHMTDRDRAIADRLGSMIRKRQGDAGT
ncbi:integrase [Streptomyces sp. LN785]